MTIDPVTLVACMGGFITACYVSANGKEIVKKGRMLFKKLSTKWTQKKWLQKILALKALKNSRDSKQISQSDKHKILNHISKERKKFYERKGPPMFV